MLGGFQNLLHVSHHGTDHPAAHPAAERDRGPAAATRLGTSCPTAPATIDEAASSRSRSTPVATPRSSRRWTKSSVARLPPAPAANGEPPSPPIDVSNRVTPADTAAKA